MKRILVTGAGGNASQNFVASLRLEQEKIFVIGADMNKYHLECSPVDKRYLIPACYQPGYLKKLKKLIEKERIDMIHAQPDVEVEYLSEHRDEVPAKLFLPSHEAILLCHDKIKTNKTLAKAGVKVPRSFLVEKADSVPEILKKLQHKDETVWLRAVRGAGSRAALPVKTKRQAQEWIHYWRSAKRLESKDFMMAEYLPGKEFAFQSLWHEGKLVTSMSRERMEYMFGNLMPSGQSSSPSIARTVHRKDVNDVGTKAVLAIDAKPNGVYCVDMKENAKGEPCVTEINIGRFFTTSNFFSVAGSNMPYFYIKLAFGESLPRLPQYNAIKEDLYWIRGVDRQPKLFEGNAWTAKPID